MSIISKPLFPVSLVNKYPEIDFENLRKRLDRAISASNLRVVINTLFDEELPAEVYDRLAAHFHLSSLYAEYWGLARLEGAELYEVLQGSSLSKRAVLSIISNPSYGNDPRLMEELISNITTINSVKFLLRYVPEEDQNNEFLTLLLNKVAENNGGEIMTADTIERKDVYATIAKIARRLYNYEEDIPDDWILQLLLGSPPKTI